MDYGYLWDSIPIGRENAATYETLCEMWNANERLVRRILHKLSLYDNGDDYVLIRSGKIKGFYKTNNEAEITAYKQECLNKGRSVFAPIKKINRILNVDDTQYSFTNNLRVVRESKGMTQKEVCKQIEGVDEALLSKMENSVILPTPSILSNLARLYGVQAHELILIDFHTVENYESLKGLQAAQVV